ncbi:MAG: FtsX-like permease family protein [Pseudobdellovibrionaceae bacterium]
MPHKTSFSNRFMGHVFAGTHAKSAHKYDIPLHNRLGTEFLVMLVALMTSLSLLAALGGITLGHLTYKWTSGLENSLTIEIPHSAEALSRAEHLSETLRKTQHVKNATIIGKKDMSRLLEPWLGNNEDMLAEIPLPVLVSLEIDERSDDVMKDITSLTRKISPEARLDTHEEWLSSLVKLTGTLRYVSYFVFALIVAVTGVVVAGAVRARMAIHQKELQLLHVMGASDGYIAHQFVRYVFWQAGKGASLGVIIGAVLIVALAYVSPSSLETLPHLSIQPWDLVLLVCVPILLLGIAMWAARHTSLQVLREMP